MFDPLFGGVKVASVAGLVELDTTHTGLGDKLQIMIHQTMRRSVRAMTLTKQWVCKLLGA